MWNKETMRRKMKKKNTTTITIKNARPTKKKLAMESIVLLEKMEILNDYMIKRKKKKICVCNICTLFMDPSGFSQKHILLYTKKKTELCISVDLFHSYSIRILFSFLFSFPVVVLVAFIFQHLKSFT